jgi:RNA polymerase sigma factor (sigma-70 family)
MEMAMVKNERVAADRLAEPETTLEVLVERAKEGDSVALENLIVGIQGRIYNLALRMLWHPADAEDASQEILIKIVTHLSQFRQESSFQTWCYRIATNHLLTTRKRRAELYAYTFERFEADLANRIDEAALIPEDSLEQSLLLEETQWRCTLGILLCLDREHRLAYILGEIVGVSGDEGAFIMETTPANYRKRLSRARERMRGFMHSHCGLVNPSNPCHCQRQLGYKLNHENLSSREAWLFAAKPQLHSEVRTHMTELQALDRTVALYRSQPQYAAPSHLIQAIKQLLNSGEFEWFSSKA